MMLREAEVVYSDREISGSGRIHCHKDVARILCNQGMARKAQEHLVVLYLNARHDCVAVETVAMGAINSVGANPREVFRGAILAGAVAIIMAHNHPSGDTMPSIDDFRMTERMEKVGEVVGIPVLDHVIVVASGQSISIMEAR